MSDEYRNALAEGTVLDTYRIERVLGEGGFGVTYLVTELNLGKEYAIKELIPDGVAIRQGGTTVMARSSSMEGDFEATRRHFIKEARVLATLKHPAIVAVHRLFEANGTCYMVMDYVEGETLGSYLKKQGGMLSSREEFEGIFYPIMDGLEVLHGKEMIHRDIKPGNIMVSPDGSPVLLDFGASCRVENHTVTMTQMVSAGYSPFEQYTARAKQGAYTDIYALGATMVRAITGAKPDDATDRMMGDTYSSMTARTELVPVYGRGLLSALDASVMVKIEDRPQSMGECRKLMAAVVALTKVEVPESPKPEREERLSEPAPSPPLPTVALTPTVELPESVISGLRSSAKRIIVGVLNQPSFRSSAKRIIVGVLVGVCLLVLIPFIAAVLDRDKGNQTATATQEPYRKAVDDVGEQKEKLIKNLEKLLSEAAVTNLFDLLVSGEELDPNFIKEIDLGSLRLMGGEGDFRAQYSLGKIYLDGLGVAKDKNEAAKWFRLAAEQSCAEAQTQLGLMYMDGLGVAKDKNEAAKWFRRAADQGDAAGQFLLGSAYFIGWGVVEDLEEAAKWYRLAAHQGSAGAQRNLGRMYYNGEGVEKDDGEAVKWYRRSADQDYAKAQFDLGLMYVNGEGVKKDDEAAVKWFRRAADRGDAEAQYSLGVMYDEGKGVKADDEEAVKWYRLAADQGDALAQNNLGRMYAYGLGVEEDDEEGVRWYRKAAEQGRASAQYNLGYVYAIGLGVTKDEKEAVSWYRLAAEQGYAIAQYKLGLMYYHGEGVAKDRKKARLWLTKAAENGNESAKQALLDLGLKKK